MELIYLWVEEYKNIHKQGFNFSGRYRCKYDDVKNELTINENKEYVHIFPDNINVTAIVGKNGSGKSSVLRRLSDDLKLVKINRELIVKQEINNNLSLKEQENLTDDIEFLNLSSDFFAKEKSATITDEHANDYNLNDLAEPFFPIAKDEKLNITKYQQNIFAIIIKHYASYKSDIFTFSPTKCRLEFGNNLKTNDTELNNLINEHKLIEQQFGLFLASKYPSKGNTYEERIESAFNHISSEHMPELSYKPEGYENFLIEIKREYPSLNDDLALGDAKWFQTTISIDSLKKFFDSKKDEDFNDIFYELIQIGFVRFELFDNDEIGLFSLSQGERSIFIDNLLLYDKIKLTTKDNICLLLDEPELSMHPAWQKSYLKALIDLTSSIKDKKFHLAIATHSPFLLSDIPSENIIFLDKDRDGKCKVVDGLKDRKQTFGANIHTLLSDAFFMEDGLMGEYAKSKINELIDYLNGKESPIKDDEEAQKHIRIIGEPILKKQLQRMLDSKRLSKIDEIDMLKAQMSEIQQKIKKLEGGK